MSVRLQNLPRYKTGLVSRQVLHLLSQLQNWIYPKTGQCKPCLVSNTKIEASIRATRPVPWQSHLTSETVEIFIQNEKAGLVPMQSRFLVRQVERRHKAGFGAAGLGTAQSWFWSRHKAGFGAVGLESAQNRFWSRHKAGFGAVGLGSEQSRFWSGWFRVGTKQVLEHAQSRFWCIKTGFASSIEATKLDLSQNGSIQNLHSIKY